MVDPRAQVIADEIKKRIADLNEQKKRSDERDKDQDERDRRLTYREKNVSRREKAIFGHTTDTTGETK